MSTVKQNTFRQSMKWFHTWVGLVVGWILFFMFVTGSTGYFYQHIDRWMEPERPFVNHTVSPQKMLDLSQAYLSEHALDAKSWSIHLPTTLAPNLMVKWRAPKKEGERRGKRHEITLDPATGIAADTRATHGGEALYEMHYRLHYIPNRTAYWIVGFCTMLMLLAVITGVVIHKKIFVDFFTFRAKKGLTGWLDIHNVLSVIALPFHFMITYSGLLFFITFYMVIATDVAIGDNEDEWNDELFPWHHVAEPANQAGTLSPLSAMYNQLPADWHETQIKYISIENPSDANSQVKFVRFETDISYNSADEYFFNGRDGSVIDMPTREYPLTATIENGFISLHEGHFADPVTRWIYFITGLIGAAMVASGLVLWTTKRKPKQLKQAGGPDFGYRLVESLNIGSIAGLPAAIAVYFLANRLLPVEFAERATWEMHSLFICWFMLLIYPSLRKKGNAWVEQLALAGALYLLIPLVNFMTTDKHLLNSLNQQDWGYAGFDLTCLFIGCLFLIGAVEVKKRIKPRSSKRNKNEDVVLPVDATPST